MYTFLADARDGFRAGVGCDACCCENISIRPGETAKIVVNYADWALPIGGYGLSPSPAIDIALISTAPLGTILPPINVDQMLAVAFNTPLSGSVATSAATTSGNPLQFAVVPLYSVRYGTLQFSPSGSFTYTPRLGYVGADDKFVFSTSDGINQPVLNTVRFVVNATAPALPLPNPIVPGTVSISPASIAVMDRMALVLPVAVDPTAKPGDIYKITIRQQATDCQGIAYAHIWCCDVRIGVC